MTLVRVVTGLLLLAMAALAIGLGWQLPAVIAIILLIPISLLIGEGISFKTVAESPKPPERFSTAGEWARSIGGVFALQLLYIALLVVLGLLVFGGGKTISWLSGAASSALGVAWFGALGAITVSIGSLSDHRDDWDSKWWYWHAMRPFAGAILGSISVLFFAAGILAVQQSPITNGGATASNNLLYYVIAFTVGYREQSFRDLVKRIIDVVIRPGTPPATPGVIKGPPIVTGIQPREGSVGTKVVISGSGFTGFTGVNFGAVGADKPTLASDTQIMALSPNQGIATVHVTVVTPIGTSTTSTNDQFTYK